MKKSDLPILGVLTILLGAITFCLAFIFPDPTVMMAVHIAVGILVIFVGLRLVFGFRNWKEGEQ